MSVKFAILAVSAAVIGSTATQILPWSEAGPLPAAETYAAFDPTNVMVTGVEQVVRELRVGATVVPVRQVTLTAQIPGTVRYIAGRAGNEVDSGAVLVEIGRDDILSRRNAAVAGLRRVESALRNAHMQYQRQLYLSRNGRSRNDMGGFMPFGMDRMTDGMMGGGPSRIERSAEVFDSRTGIAKAQNAVTAARSSIDEIDAAIANSDSRAPFDGVIFQKLVEQGDTVQRGQALMVLADISELEVEVDVPANLAARLRQGSALEVDLDGAQGTVMATIRQVYPMANAITHTVRVKVTLPQDAPATAGMYAAVLIPERSPDAADGYPTVPVSALTYREGLSMVYVVDDSGQPQLRLVRLGGKTRSGIAVTAGLEEGDQVLVDTVQYSARLAARGPSA